MKTISMGKRGGAFAALVLCLAMSNGAFAATISIGSEIGFIGTYTPTGGSGLGDATGLSFVAATVIIGSDDFAGQVGGAVTVDDLALGGPAGPLFTTAGGLSFTVTSLSVNYQTANALDFTATGIWSLAGFDDTAGTFEWTGDSLNGLYTYSASGAVVPVPAAVWLFASGLAGLGLIRRRRS